MNSIMDIILHGIPMPALDSEGNPTEWTGDDGAYGYAHYDMSLADYLAMGGQLGENESHYAGTLDEWTKERMTIGELALKSQKANEDRNKKKQTKILLIVLGIAAAIVLVYLFKNAKR